MDSIRKLPQRTWQHFGLANLVSLLHPEPSKPSCASSITKNKSIQFNQALHHHQLPSSMICVCLCTSLEIFVNSSRCSCCCCVLLNLLSREGLHRHKPHVGGSLRQASEVLGTLWLLENVGHVSGSAAPPQKAPGCAPRRSLGG